MIKEAYCSDEVCKLLKEKGFNEPCTALNRLVIQDGEKPFMKVTHQKAMAWLREEKGIAVVPLISSVLDHKSFLWDIKIFIAKTNDTYSQGWVYESYEEAVEAALKYCLENLI